jgi:DNA polymerase-3 subunit delta'
MRHVFHLQRISRGVHSDVLIVEPGENGSTKPIKSATSSIAGVLALRGLCRVVIIDDADRLIAGAQNALLKTFEDASSSVFILVTSRPDILLATVQSRCPRCGFVRRCRRRGRRAHAPRAERSRGPRHCGDRRWQHGRALEASGRELVEAREITMVSPWPRAMTRAVVSRAVSICWRTLEAGAADRDRLAALVMASFVRDVELVNPRDDHVLANADVRPVIERLSAHGGSAASAFTAIDQGLAALERNAGVKIVADWVMLQL